MEFTKLRMMALGPSVPRVDLVPKRVNDYYDLVSL